MPLPTSAGRFACLWRLLFSWRPVRVGRPRVAPAGHRPTRTQAAHLVLDQGRGEEGMRRHASGALTRAWSSDISIAIGCMSRIPAIERLSESWRASPASMPALGAIVGQPSPSRRRDHGRGQRHRQGRAALLAPRKAPCRIETAKVQMCKGNIGFGTTSRLVTEPLKPFRNRA